MTVRLPKPIAEYFAATNTDDAGHVDACFAEAAAVREEGRDIRGRAAVRAWARQARRKYRFLAEEWPSRRRATAPSLPPI